MQPAEIGTAQDVPPVAKTKLSEASPAVTWAWDDTDSKLTFTLKVGDETVATGGDTGITIEATPAVTTKPAANEEIPVTITVDGNDTYEDETITSLKATDASAAPVTPTKTKLSEASPAVTWAWDDTDSKLTFTLKVGDETVATGGDTGITIEATPAVTTKPAANEEIPVTITVDGNDTYEDETITSVKATDASAELGVIAFMENNEEVPGDSVLTPITPAFAYTYSSIAQPMTVNVYKESIMNRLYNPNSGEHFYTRDTHERDVLVSLGWQAEGVGWVAPKASEGTAPVYRLYNANAGDHHYTKDANEKDTLVKIGWSFEGVGWYSAADPKVGNRTIEVFREYNPNAKEAGAHNYTISENENATLVSLGWTDEGIAWNALK
ncbi:MAG: hypothetical protein K2H85_09880 [Allobaculum sp.]|nr:hypothetical protein [Allobaculum sp.]